MPRTNRDTTPDLTRPDTPWTGTDRTTGCTACGGTVSREARTCPHCGQPRDFLLPKPPAVRAGIGADLMTALFWVWQGVCLLVVALTVMQAGPGPVSPLGLAWLLRDGIATWAAGSVGLAACRWMAR